MSFSKYAIEKKQVSMDKGVTWQDATPLETRNGRLLGTYKTLIECKNKDCDLEKWGIQLVDEKIPTRVCTHVNSTSGKSTSYDTYLPSGIAKSVTFVSGITSGMTSGIGWGSSDNIIKDEYRNSSITAKTATINTRWNPIRAEYNSYVLDGSEMISGSFSGKPTCYNITEFMPWIDPNGTIKMAYKVHYVKEHCSDEWKIDEEYAPTLITFGERWVKTSEDIYKTTWQHQIATDVVSDDSELGWKAVWENEGEAFDYEYEVSIPQDVEIIEYLRADGVAASAIESTDFYQMKVKIDPRNLGTPSGYLAYKMPYSESDPICFWHLYKKATSYYVEARCTESLTELTPNEWKWINIDMAKTKYIGLFCQIYIRNFDPYPQPNAYTLKNAYVGGLIHIDGNMYYPYKIYSNNGWEDEYLNGSEYGFIDRKGNKIPLEYVYGKYTNTDGVTQDLKVNADKKLGARSDVVDVVFSNYVTSLPEGVCSGCTSMTSVDIPSSVTVIGEAAFRGCTSLTSVDIPSRVTVIGIDAFRECTSLTIVDIPSSVTEIGDMAFKDCRLGTVNMYSIHPPHVGIGVFTRGIITIPPEADLEEWKTAEGWPRYADKIIKRGSGSKVEPYIYRDSSHKGFISDLGVTLKDNTRIEIKLRPTSNGGGMIIGEVNPPNDDDDYRFFWYNTRIFYDYGSDRMDSPLAINTDYVLEVGNYYIKDLTSGNYILQGDAKSGVATAHTRTLGLFGDVNEDYGFIYYIKIYEGDTLVKDFVPVKSEDGSVTLYDNVSKTHCSVSNGTFGAPTE